MSRNNNLPVQKPRILFLDTAYTLRIVRERALEQEYESRNCGGYFEHVWGVHPIADIPERRPLEYQGFRVSEVKFSQDQTIIEGVSAYYKLLRRVTPINFLVSQARFISFLVRLVKREKISVVLSSDPLFCGLIGLAVKYAAGIPLVIWVCANYDDLYAANKRVAMPRLFRWRWVEKIVERAVLRRADLVAGGNQDNLEYALRNGATQAKSTVFPVGKLIHRQHLIERSERSVDELFTEGNGDARNQYWFIYIGRLVKIKHPDDVLRAFSVIEKSVRDARLIIAGDGVMRPELEQIARDQGIADKVKFLGNISQERLSRVLAGCFAILSPLTGRSLIEGGLAGLPIVAYDRDWQSEFVGQSGAGIVVPFRDWQAMGERAIELVQKPEMAKKLGDAARREAMRRCDLDALYGHERNEYEKLLNSSTSSPLAQSQSK